MRRLSTGAAIGCVARIRRAGRTAVELFPAGVPGYGEAPGVTVASRVRPDFDPPGVRVGSFLLRPRWAEGLGYDNNVFGSSERRARKLDRRLTPVAADRLRLVAQQPGRLCRG